MDEVERLRASVLDRNVPVLNRADERAYRDHLAHGRVDAAQAVRDSVAELFAIETRLVRRMNLEELRGFDRALSSGDSEGKFNVLSKTIHRLEAAAGREGPQGRQGPAWPEIER